MKVLLIEDDMAVGRALLAVLQDAGHRVVWMRLAANAAKVIADGGFHALLLDLGLPDGDGVTLLRDLRAAGVQVPVLILTSRGSLDDRLKGFHSGADDYLTKPFDIPELLVRLQAIVRRAGLLDEMAKTLFKAGDLELDEQRQLVTKGGASVALSRTEFALLCALMREPERVLTRGELKARAVPQGESHTLDSHMSNLRKKIGEGYIRTVRGVGYMVHGVD